MAGKEIIDALDNDNDGTIDFNELSKFLFVLFNIFINL